MSLTWKVLWISTLSMILTACGGTDSPPVPSAVSSRVYGLVELDGPVENAKVVVTDLNSMVIAEGRTNDKGAFSLPIERNYTDFTVSASGGTNKMVTVTGTLLAEVRGRPVQGAYTAVNPATSLVGLRMKQQPGMSYETALAEVKRFLGIPRSHGLGFDLKPSTFSGAVFRNSSNQAANLDSYLSTLSGELANGKTRFFRQLQTPSATAPLLSQSQAPRQMLLANVDPGGGSIAGTIASGVLNGVLAKVGGLAFESILGLAKGASDPSADSQAIAGLVASAARQEAKLDEISSAVTALSAQLDNLIDEVLLRIEKDSYLTAESVATRDPLLFNRHVEGELMYIGKNLDTDGHVTKGLDDYIEQSLRTTDLMAAWSLALRGTGTSDGGLIVRWNRVVSSARPDVFDENEAKQIQAHWDLYDGHQAKTILLLSDHMRSKPSVYSETKILDMFETWRLERKKQLVMLRGNLKSVDEFYMVAGKDVVTDSTSLEYLLPPNAVIDRTTGQMWLRTAVQRGTFDNFAIDPWVIGLVSPTLKYDAIVRILQIYANTLTGLKGWRYPHTREAMWSASDLTGFARLRKLGINISDSEKIFYRDTVAERTQRAAERYNEVRFDRTNQLAASFRGSAVPNLNFCGDPGFLPLAGAGQELTYFMFPALLFQPNSRGFNFELGWAPCAQLDLSEDDMYKYRIPYGADDVKYYNYDPRNLKFSIYYTRDAADYFY